MRPQREKSRPESFARFLQLRKEHICKVSKSSSSLLIVHRIFHFYTIIDLTVNDTGHSHLTTLHTDMPIILFY